MTTEPDIALLERVAQRVLWLSTRIIDAANHDRPNPDPIKIGGHQASSASIANIMTALYLHHLNAADQVSVKPHASPVYHAISYLLGNLDRSYLTRLREFGGLQSYPSRTKDPDHPDFSTGSVGLGAAAPLFSAVTRRYVDSHFGARPQARFVAIIGDAELDEGNIWEAVADTATQGLGNALWIVDLNRQSLDRVIPGIRIDQWHSQFSAAGWHVVQVKYGKALAEAFARPGGEHLRQWIDDMPNEQYQALFAVDAASGRARFLDGAPQEVHDFLAAMNDEEALKLVTDLGGHDFASLLDAFAQCDAVTDRPSVIFAYTVKGWGLPLAGNVRNHAAVMTQEAVAELRSKFGLTPETEWDRFSLETPEGQLCAARQAALTRNTSIGEVEATVPADTGLRSSGATSTQEAFGRILSELSRDEALRRYLVTTAPDVATSTNLGGFINRCGVYSPEQRRTWNEDPVLKWAEGPTGHHIELGISEMNLFTLLGALGLASDHSYQRLIPVGTVYDPFVVRGLDAFVHGVYSGARFILAGTPSGVTLAPEGGAHQSTITASIGIELPGVVLNEPAYAQALDWLLCDAVRHVAGHAVDTTPDLRATELAYYFRLTTRQIDQSPFEAARTRIGEALLRRQVLAGAYRLIDGWERLGVSPADAADEYGVPKVHLVASGSVVPEVLAAAAELASEGIVAHVVDVTSPSRLYNGWQRTLRQGVRTATTPSNPGVLRAVIGETAPVVTVHDAASHAMSWLGSALGMPQVPLGVDNFGQSGSIGDLYRANDLDPGSIVNAAIAAITLYQAQR